MNNIHLLNKAVCFASEVHRSQTRKGKKTPYVTHVLAIGIILSGVSKEDNVIAAGILHDTIEDCEPYGSITKAFLEMEFNAEIARMVNDVTEQDKSKPWFKRKMEALKHIKHMKHDSLLVKSADVLQNLTELNEDLKKEGILVFNKFNASKEETILRYTLLIPEIKSAWDGNPLVAELELGLAGLLEYNEKNDTTHNN